MKTAIFKNLGIRIVLLGCLCGLSLEAYAVTINEIRAWNSPERTRVVFDLSDEITYKLFELDNPRRIVIDINDGKFSGQLPSQHIMGPLINNIRVGIHPGKVRFVLDLHIKARHKNFTLKPNQIYGDRLVIDVEPHERKPAPASQPKTKSEFLVIIDAGHGGEDPGAIGSNRTFEKHLVLEIAKRLRKHLNAQPGIRAELTRTGDYYIPLRRRTQIAIERQADLFVSIHADAFTRKSANGVSVFALSTRGATSERAKLIANKENSSDMLGGENLAEIDDEVVEVLADLALDKQIERSLDVGAKVRMRLSNIARMHGHGVEQAGFVVLKTPQIPSILVEVGFISNPAEERKLNTSAYQNKIVQGISQAVVQFARENPWSQSDWRTASN